MVSTGDIIGGDKSFLPTYCLPESYGFVEKSFLFVSFYFSPIALCVVLYLSVWSAGKLLSTVRISAPLQPLKEKLVTCIFTILDLFFLPIAKTLFELVTCTRLEVEGKDVSVLTAQASVECYTGWQYAVWTILLVYIFPYCVFVYVCLRHRGESSKVFLLGFMPVVSIVCLLVEKVDCKSYGRRVVRKVRSLCCSEHGDDPEAQQAMREGEDDDDGDVEMQQIEQSQQQKILLKFLSLKIYYHFSKDGDVYTVRDGVKVRILVWHQRGQRSNPWMSTHQNRRTKNF